MTKSRCGECGFLLLTFRSNDQPSATVPAPASPATAEERGAYFMRKGGLSQHHGFTGEYRCYRGIDIQLENLYPTGEWTGSRWEPVVNRARDCRFFEEYVPGADFARHLELQLKRRERKDERRWALGMTLLSAALGGAFGVATALVSVWLAAR